MPRIAIGDLTIDVDVPPRFTCEYSLNGSLIAESAGTGEIFELSAITVEGGPTADIVIDRAKTANRPLHEQREHFVSFFDGAHTWFAAIPGRVLVATLTQGSPPEFAAILSSVAPAHAPFVEGEALQLQDLRPSHTRFFEQRRNALLDNLGWSPQLRDAIPKLENFWNELLDDAPQETDLLSTMINSVAIGFGDLLCTRGFTWVIGHDAYGTTLGVVALRGTANVWVVPENFIGKRWESKERDFIGHGLDAIMGHVEKMKADWKNSVS
ncbi:MAG: hypothetical protein ACO1OB_30205 [Archangium sp.]